MLGDQPKTSVIEVLLLHSRADRALRSLLAGQFDKHNITMMEWLLLGVLAGGSRDGLSISTVAAKLDVAPPQVTALMARLQKKKLSRTSLPLRPTACPKRQLFVLMPRA